MVGTIIESGLNINYWIASDNTTVKSLFDTLLNWFAVFLRNHTTFNHIDKLEALTWLVWFKLNPNVTVLTTTTRLLNVFTLSFSGATNSFTVGNLWSTGICFNIVLTFQTVDNDFKVQFTHTRNNSLAGFFIGVNTEGWILLSKLSETETHFFLIGLGFWLDGDRDWRFWELNRLKKNWVGWITKSGTSSGFLETDDGGNITCSNFSNFFTLISKHTDKTTNALFVSSSSIIDVGT